MKYSEYLIKTRKDTAKEIESINGDLLIRGSFIDQLSAGVYTFLPLGLRVLRKIENIIREEMDNIGGQEVVMPILQPKENWTTTGRWESVDDLFRFTSYYTKTDYALAETAEEIVSPLLTKFVQSYKDLPKAVYQIENKFRDEKRAKAGLLRGRQFPMKDLYSFHADEADLDRYYQIVKEAYIRIYDRVGIGSKTYYTFASGGTFSKYSHEFQTESASGEDLIYLCNKCKVAINKEIIEEQNTCPECGSSELSTVKSIEVGNIFKLRTRFSEPFNLKYTTEGGEERIVEMGCYGIGSSRLMGTIVEVCHDERGIIWPTSIAPFMIHLVALGDEKAMKTAEKVYKDLVAHGYEVLFDDRDETAGSKLADADLIGCPIRLVVSKKTIDADSVELKLRSAEKSELVRLDEYNAKIKELLHVK